MRPVNVISSVVICQDTVTYRVTAGIEWNHVRFARGQPSNEYSAVSISNVSV